MIDQQVRDYLDALKYKYYTSKDNSQRNGLHILNKMIGLAKQLIDTRKYQITEKNRNFLNKRLALISHRITELDESMEILAIEDEYPIFVRNAQELAGQSTYMDTTNGRINAITSNILRKIRAYKREQDEIVYTLAIMDDLQIFFENAKEELTELENEINNT